jgi:hypothetical protein
MKAVPTRPKVHHSKKKEPEKKKKAGVAKQKPFVPTVPYTEADRAAAVVIQKHVRGFLTRKRLEGERWLLAANSDQIMGMEQHMTATRVRVQHRRPPTRGHHKTVKSKQQAVPDRDPGDEAAAAALKAKYRDPSRPMSSVTGTDLGSALKSLKKAGTGPATDSPKQPRADQAQAAAAAAEPKQTSLIGKLLGKLLRKRAHPSELVEKKILHPEDNPLKGSAADARVPGTKTSKAKGKEKAEAEEPESSPAKSKKEKAKEEKEAKKRKAKEEKDRAKKDAKEKK